MMVDGPEDPVITGKIEEWKIKGAYSDE